ncbi:MAG: ParB N-terminal domain-containing protein [Patescibacteria group bacterium]
MKARGLKALIPTKPRVKPKRKKESVYYVEIKKIKEKPEDMKRILDQKILEEMADSIRKYGVVQPLILARVEKKKRRGINVYYELVSGKKRLIAAKEAGLKVVPAVIKALPKQNDKNLKI